MESVYFSKYRLRRADEVGIIEYIQGIGQQWDPLFKKKITAENYSRLFKIIRRNNPGIVFFDTRSINSVIKSNQLAEDLKTKKFLKIDFSTYGNNALILGLVQLFYAIPRKSEYSDICLRSFVTLKEMMNTHPPFTAQNEMIGLVEPLQPNNNSSNVIIIEDTPNDDIIEEDTPNDDDKMQIDTPIQPMDQPMDQPVDWRHPQMSNVMNSELDDDISQINQLYVSRNALGRTESEISDENTPFEENSSFATPSSGNNQSGGVPRVYSRSRAPTANTSEMFEFKECTSYDSVVNILYNDFSDHSTFIEFIYNVTRKAKSKKAKIFNSCFDSVFSTMLERTIPQVRDVYNTYCNAEKLFRMFITSPKSKSKDYVLFWISKISSFLNNSNEIRNPQIKNLGIKTKFLVDGEPIDCEEINMLLYMVFNKDGIGVFKEVFHKFDTVKIDGQSGKRLCERFCKKIFGGKKKDSFTKTFNNFILEKDLGPGGYDDYKKNI